MQLHLPCGKCGGAGADCLCRQTLDRTVERLLEADRKMWQTISVPPPRIVIGLPHRLKGWFTAPMQSSDFEDWDQGPESYPVPPEDPRKPDRRFRHPHALQFVFWTAVVVLSIVFGIWVSGAWR